MADMPKGAVAVVGMACRFPGAGNVDEFWRNLRNGVESIVPLSDETLMAAGVKPEELSASNYVKAAAVLEDMEMFDAGFFGFSPKEASIMDPQHRHFLECSWEALEHAGHDPFAFPGSVGVFAGCGMQAYFARNLLPNRDLIDGTGFFLVRHTGNDKDFLATRLSYQLNLRGPSLSIQTACSTSLVAIHMAAQSVLAGECDMALAGGVTIELPHRQGYLYQEGEILSRDGHCRAFDAASTGTVFGSGAGVVVLRRLEDALADGDTIHAVVLGSAINNDGAGKVSYLAPSVEGQAAAVAEALAVAGVPASTISFVETHGTGTQIGDPIEVTALTRAYRESTSDRGFCALGAVKTNIGHLDTAAGVAAFIKAALALCHRQLPPTLHFTRANPQIDFTTTPFFVNASLRDWTLPANVKRRRAGVNALGVGGTNAHVILEEPPALPPTSDAPPGQLLVWSARSGEAVRRQSASIGGFLKEHPDIRLADAAFTLQLGRHPFSHRRILAVADGRDAMAALETGDRRRIFDGIAPQKAPPLAFMFPGGGAQYPNMGRELYHREAVYREVVDESLNLLRLRWNIELRSLLFPEAGRESAAAAQLENPLSSILSIFLTEYALARLWISMGIQPQVLTGHSLGEYTAACLAGVMSLEAALAIVVARGRIFEKLPQGAMLSVALSEQAILPLLGPHEALAAVNAPELSVVSGAVDAIKALEGRLLAQEIECQRLRISVAAHSEMLDPHLDEFRQAFNGIRLHPPKMPFISNLTGELADSEMVTTPDYWVRHLRTTVRFSAGIRTLQSRHPGCLLLEVGPSTTLCALARQHPVAGAEPVAIPSMRHPKDPGSDVVCLLSGLGRLWAAGLVVDWSVLHRDQARRRVPLPTYPFEHKKYWIEPQVGPPLAATSSPREGMTRRNDVEQWLAHPVWESSPADFSAPRMNADVFVLVAGEDDGRDGFSAELGRMFRHGTDAKSSDSAPHVISVRRGTAFLVESKEQLFADLSSKAEMSKVLDFAFSRAQRGVCLVLLNGTSVRTNAESVDQTWDQGLAGSFFSVVQWTQCLGERQESKKWWLRLVTHEAFSIADEIEVDPAASLAAAACRVIPRELSEARCQVIDLPKIAERGRQRTEILRQLAVEIGIDANEREVVLRAGRRWMQRLEPFSWKAHATSDSLLRKSGVYLITGGLGGLGFELAKHLAGKYGARLVLVSRKGAEATAGRAALVRELQLLTEVMVCVADVADASSMKAAVGSAEKRFGKINGVFHCAGELHDGLLLAKSSSEMERVLRPKVMGALVLDELFAGSELDFMVLYSSVSAWLGLPGQVDYAAANAFLDAMAWRAARNRDYPVLSLGWGAWRDVGMAARLAQGGEPAGNLPSHPLLQRRTNGAGENKEFFAVLDAERNWILDGHRTNDGVALLPGTAYLELARAVSNNVMPGQRVTLGDLVFIAPLVVEGPTELRLQLDMPDGDFIVASRPLVDGSQGTWVEHARGRISASAAVSPARPEISAFRSACGRKRVFRPGDHSTRQEQMLRFGARWSTLRQACFGDGMAIGELELAAEFVSDLAETPLHPALLDIATAFALPLVDGYEEANSFYVPLSYRRVTIHRGLEPSILSLVRCRDPRNSDTVVFDLTLVSTAGEVLVEIAEFVMKRLPDGELSVKQARPSAGMKAITSAAEMTLDRVVADGIASADGMRVLERLLRVGSPPQILVSPYDLVAWNSLLEVAQSIQDGPAAGPGTAVVSLPRPSISTPFVPPANEVEERLASIWKGSLGLAEIGVEDNFFELGGHSLGLVQVIMKCRKALQADIPVGDPELLGNPTIKAMARFASAKCDLGSVVELASIKKVSRDRYRAN